MLPTYQSIDPSARPRGPGSQRAWGRLAAGAVAATALVALAACQPTPGGPALRQTPAAPRVWDSSDPSVLVTGGRTYLFGSTNNKKLPVREITSFNQTLDESRRDWASNPRDAMPSRPAWIDPGEWEIWAPSPVKIDTRYYVYFAGHRAGAVDEANDQCIGRAVASSPLGPYVPESTPLYCGLRKVDAGANSWGHGALDPEVFTAPDGRRYLLVALSRTTANIGVVRLDSAGRPVDGSNASPTTLARQQYPWHDGTDDQTLGPAFLENPSMVYEPKSRTYLLFYSAGYWASDRYNTGFGRCSSPLGPCTLDSRGPFLKGDTTRSGPGGLTAFRAADDTLRVGYSSWLQGHENEWSPDGSYSRQLSWETIQVTGLDPQTQGVALV